MLSLLSQCVVVYMHVVKSAPVPGIGWIGSSIHLLYGLDPFGSIIQHVYSGGKTTDGRFDLSQKVVHVPNVKCSYTSTSLTAETYDEYQAKKTSSHKIGGTFKMFTGAYSSTTESVKQQIYNNGRVASLVTANCVQYELNLLWNGAPLQPWFVEDAKSLPSQLSTSANYQRYFDFFDYYGSHVITGCEMGGQLSQFSFTTQAYVASKSKQETTKQAEATFFVSVDGSKSTSTSIDSGYKSSTSTFHIQTNGGSWPSSIDNWNPWIQSVQRLENVACLNWSAREITDVWAWNSELAAKQGLAKLALAEYFNVRGCTLPSAPNYDRFALVNVGCQFPSLTPRPTSKPITLQRPPERPLCAGCQIP